MTDKKGGFKPPPVLRVDSARNRELSRLRAMTFQDLVPSESRKATSTREASRRISIRKLARRDSALNPLDQTLLSTYTLAYRDERTESMFRKDLFHTSHQRLVKLVVGLTLLLAVGMTERLWRFHANDSVLKPSVGWGGGSVLSILMVALMGAVVEDEALVTHASAGLVTLAGLLWALFVTAHLDNTGSEVNASSFIAFLAIVHVLGKYLFPVIVASSVLLTVVFAVCVYAFAATGESTAHALSQVGYVVLANFILCYGSREFERYRRYSFVLRRLAEQERDQMAAQASKVKEEMYNYVLRHLDIADADDVEIDLKSPMEKALVILQDLVRKPDVAGPVKGEIKQVITYLATNTDIFLPDIDDDLNEHNLDDDTQHWLLDLIDGTHHFTRSREQFVMNPPHKSSVGAAELGSAMVNMTNEEVVRYDAMLLSADTAQFDVFLCDELTKGHPVVVMGIHLLRKYSLIQRFRIDASTLTSFLGAIESGYQDNPYHNRMHAADVTQACHFYLSQGDVARHFSDLELYALIVAAIIHDYDHPGFTNAYHVATQDKKAILYNDQSVLENHHAAAAFTELMKPENNIAKSLSREEFMEFRAIVVNLVLATDLAHHFEFLGHFNKQNIARGGKQSMATQKSNDKDAREFRLMVMKMVLKCADVSHTCRQLPLHLKWTHRVMDEFFRQGDEERKRGLPISPFMDREKKNLPKAQIGFMNFLVKPMLEAWRDFLSTDEEVPQLTALNYNRSYWVDQADTKRDEEVKSKERIQYQSSRSSIVSGSGSALAREVSSEEKLQGKGTEEKLPDSSDD